MAYRLKHKQRKISSRYFEEKEAQRLRKKYPKGVPYSELSRFGLREMSGTTAKMHKKGNIIEFKGGLAKIDKVEKKGIWIIPYNSKSMALSKKKIFISEEKIEKGKAYPSYVNFIP